tara:strand:- start:1077 stop:1844 length:768 start_codon:yes stop_codon:yes gene_type:complete
MKVLLTNGDSWTQGDSPSQVKYLVSDKTLDWYDIIPNFGYSHSGKHSKKLLYKFYGSDVWPKVLGKKLGVETWNAGRLGDDNKGIACRTINSVEYLKSLGKKDIFVIIGWTTAFRAPVIRWNEKKEQFTMHNVRPHTQGIENLDFYGRTVAEFTNDCLSHILFLQYYLEYYNIDYLFFNAFDEITINQTTPQRHLVKYENWIDNNANPGHFKEYILKTTGLKDWNENKYFTTWHPRDNAHILWGEYLYDYIKKYK